jgi:putative oxidoreductase
VLAAASSSGAVGVLCVAAVILVRGVYFGGLGNAAATRVDRSPAKNSCSGPRAGNGQAAKNPRILSRASTGGGMNLAQNFDLTNPATILRIMCGLFLLPHLYAKASNFEFTFNLYREFRLNPPKVWVYSCVVIETVCSISMVLGIATRYVALAEAVFLAVAAWAVWRYARGKWLWNIGGYEYCAFWSICCLVVAMIA